MKRVTAWLFAALTLLLLLSLTSCGEKLKAPETLSVDADNKLSWKNVESARFYTVEIQNVNGGEPTRKTTRLTTFSLYDLAVGDYEIRVMATGGTDNELTSPWSGTLAFHRDYESGCVYELYNGNSEYRILRAGSANGEVLIEGTYRGKPVTAIGDGAFKGNREITSIVIGNNLRTIGDSAFYNCLNLTSVTLPDSVTSIGESAFQGCRALTQVNLPAGINAIPGFCFTYCRKLASVALNDRIKTIGESAFNGTALTSLEIPDSVTGIGKNAFSDMKELTAARIGRGVSTIEEGAFSENPQLTSVVFAEGGVLNTLGSQCFQNDALLTEITLPAGLASIGDRCFYSCDVLTSVVIPDSVTGVGAQAFVGTKLYKDSPSDFVYADRWLIGVKNLNSYVKIEASDIRSDTVGIGDACFARAKALENITLPASVQTVGQYAFQNCPELMKFTAGASLIRIRKAAFNLCAKLFSLTLNDALEEIDDYAFYGCKLLRNNLLNPLVPKNVVRIGQQAFAETGLPDDDTNKDSNVIYAGNWVVGYRGSIGYDQNNKVSLGTVTLSDKVVGVADFAFYDCDSLINLVNLSKCRYIGKGAFYNCVKLETVQLHPRLKTLPDFVFYRCKSLYQISVPTLLESIGTAAFYRCTMLRGSRLAGAAEDAPGTEKEYTLDFSLTTSFRSIGTYAFYGCTNLRNVNLGDKLTEIGDEAFYYCKELQSVTIADTVREIPDKAFAFCYKLGTVNFGAGVERIGDYAFYKCGALKEIRMPASLQAIGNYAFYKCTAVTTLNVGENLRTIGDYAFLGLINVTTMRLPSTLTGIGTYACKGMESLRTLIIPKQVADIRSNAFYGCYRVTFYVEEGADASGWNLRWNSSNRPVVSGVRLSETGDYVSSVTVRGDTVQNGISLSDVIIPISAPERAGYTFAGWAREDGTTVTAAELVSQPEGTVLEATWLPSA